MSKITTDDLVKMMQQLEKESSRKHGYPLLDDAAELLENATLRLHDLESENEDLRRAIKAIGESVHAVRGIMKEGA